LFHSPSNQLHWAQIRSRESNAASHWRASSLKDEEQRSERGEWSGEETDPGEKKSRKGKERKGMKVKRKGAKEEREGERREAEEGMRICTFDFDRCVVCQVCTAKSNGRTDSFLPLLLPLCSLSFSLSCSPLLFNTTLAPSLPSPAPPSVGTHFSHLDSLYVFVFVLCFHLIQSHPLLSGMANTGWVQ